MQVVTEAFRKIADGWDDQPGFVNRDMNPGGIGQGGPYPDSVDDLLNRWERRKKKRRANPVDNQRGVIQVYQLGLELPKTRKEEARPLINL
jgi:hypothetical protein